MHLLLRNGCPKKTLLKKITRSIVDQENCMEVRLYAIDLLKNYVKDERINFDDINTKKRPSNM